MNIVSLKEKLLTLYPNKEIVKLHKIDEELYKEIIEHCVKGEISLKEFFEKHSFEFKEGSLEEKYEKKLLEIFPNRNVKVFSMKDSNLYSTLKGFCIIRNIDLRSWFKMHKFDFESVKRESKKDVITEKVLKELKIKFPNKKVYRLSTDHKKLYARIYVLSKNEGKNVKEWLTDNGFESSKRKTKKENESLDLLQNSNIDYKIEIDEETLKKQKNELEKIYQFHHRIPPPQGTK